MQIISGFLRGRKMDNSSIPSQLARKTKLSPSTSLTKSTLFNILAHNPLFSEIPIEESEVLDLCCGTGAVGFEFISRGAKMVTFVDKYPEMIENVRINAQKLGVAHQISHQINKLPSATLPMADIIFFDPPYKETELLKNQFEIIANNAEQFSLLICEYHRSSPTPNSINCNLILEREINNGTKLAFYAGLKKRP